MMASLAMQQKEMLASAEAELEGRGMGKQEAAERGQVPSWCKSGEAFQVLPVAEYVCRVWLAKVLPRCWLLGGYGPWGRGSAHGRTSGPNQRERGNVPTNSGCKQQHLIS